MGHPQSLKPEGNGHLPSAARKGQQLEEPLKESNSLGTRNNTRKMPQILKMPRGGEREEEKKAEGMREDN